MCGSAAKVSDFWLGVVAAFVGDIILNLGINLQRYAHLKIEAQPVADRRHYTRHPIWVRPRARAPSRALQLSAVARSPRAASLGLARLGFAHRVRPLRSPLPPPLLGS